MSDESKRYGAQGGKARAAKLTPTQRSNSAALAAAARWQKGLPTAEWGSADNPLNLGGLMIPCYVLDDERRVLVQRGLQTGIGMSTSGGTGGAHRMARFIESLEAKGLETNNLAMRIGNPIVFRVKGLPKPAYGYEAIIVPEILKAISDAGKAGWLLKSQEKYARQCDIALLALAGKGIDSLVDEVTGFKESSDREQIAKFLGVYVKKELRQWVHTFPRSFFEQLCRLKGIPFPKDNMRMPQYMGNVINDLVYTRLAPGVLPELRSVNPVVGPNGRRRGKHHSALTENAGHPKLLHLIGKLEGMAYAFEDGDYEAYKVAVDRAIPNYGSLPLWQAQQIPERIEAAHAKLALPRAPSEPLALPSAG